MTADPTLTDEAAAESCYCACHSSFSSRAWCEHCKGDNEVNRLPRCLVPDASNANGTCARALPCDVHPPLTDEELAEMEAMPHVVWWRYKQDVPRLIAALRAKSAEVERLCAVAAEHAARITAEAFVAERDELRAEVERLTHELAEVSEAFELARAGSWTGWKDMGE